MEISILGNNGPFPSAGGACSGYLIRSEGINLLIDCGNGVLANLLKFIKIEELDYVILTHLHSDHMSDLMVLRYAIDIKIKRGSLNKPLKVFSPDSPEEEYNRLNIKKVFELKPIYEDTLMELGNFRISFCEMKHPVRCYAVRIDSKNRSFVFSGDTAWNEKIIEFSKNADIVMLDSGLLTKDKTDDNVPHLTARECGIIARNCGAKRLLLTHFWPEYNLIDILSEAKETFLGAELSEMFKTYIVT